MAEKGRIVKLNPKGFGFVSRAGGRDVFVPSFELRKCGADDGDEVEFEVVPDPKSAGKEMASKLTMIAKATAPAPPTPRALGVSWKFGTIINGLLPVVIQIMRGSAAALDLTVRLLANGKKVSNPKDKLSPDSSGTVAFVVDLVKAGLAADAKQCVLMAQINGQIFSTLWEATAKTAAAKSALLVERTSISKDRIYTYRVSAPLGVEVVVEGQIPIQFRKHGEVGWLSQPIKTDADGTLVEVQVTQDGSRGDVFFVTAGLRSQPQYVTHHNPPVRVTPAKK